MTLRYRPPTRIVFACIAAAFLCFILLIDLGCKTADNYPRVYTSAGTIAGTDSQFGEPFGITVKGSDVYVSDGESGKIWRIAGDGNPGVFVAGLDTPSGIAFDSAGGLFVADSGTNTIDRIDASGQVTVIAGIKGKSGFADGEAMSAQFNRPIGVAVGSDGKIFVADTYNDRIRVIENGRVTTLSGGDWGFADGTGADAKFFTPCGLAIFQDKLLVADTGNGRIRVVEPDGRTWTLAGSGDRGLRDGLLASASFVAPTALAVDNFGSIFVADGNAIRRIGGAMPIVSTITDPNRGLRDGPVASARFNRPSGMAVDGSGRLIIADSDNRLVRMLSANAVSQISAEQIAALREKPGEFRKLQPPRWPYNPPDAKREIAGTLGEIRGEIPEITGPARFHNGLDIAGAYGETARFIRDEKVLQPIAAENFGTLRELLRLPTLGYVHVRLGRDALNRSFGDPRFQFLTNGGRTQIGIRVARGTKFSAGEPIGTLNPMNHVHLIAGRSGAEMNAIEALVLPGLADTRPPVIEKVLLFDENWNEIETAGIKSRIKLSGKIRIVVRAYDQVDGNAGRRRLGVYQVGYRILRFDGSVVQDHSSTIKFDRFPSSEAVKYVYAAGSKSGATGETIFNYIATNSVEGDNFNEGFIDPSELNAGIYDVQVVVSDYFGNIASKIISVEVTK